jgi:S-DNA-T family DNA segregation ATPase FtsK/SpoIIIE
MVQLHSAKKQGVEFSIEERHEEPELEIAPIAEEEESNSNYAQVFGNYDPTLDLPNYQYPPVELLSEYQTDKVQVTCRRTGSQQRPDCRNTG